MDTKKLSGGIVEAGKAGMVAVAYMAQATTFLLAGALYVLADIAASTCLLVLAQLPWPPSRVQTRCTYIVDGVPRHVSVVVSVRSRAERLQVVDCITQAAARIATEVENISTRPLTTPGSSIANAMVLTEAEDDSPAANYDYDNADAYYERRAGELLAALGVDE